MNLSPLTIRRLKNFKANKRGYYSALVFTLLFFISIFAEFISNDKPILVVFDNKFLFPVFEKIPETFYGGEFETEADYKDPYVKNLIKARCMVSDRWWLPQRKNERKNCMAYQARPSQETSKNNGSNKT